MDYANNYRIIHKDKKESECVTKDLSSKVSIDCEILEIHQEKEVYVGLITKRCLFRIATDVADYAIKSIPNQKSPVLEEYLLLCRMWQEDPLSVTYEMYQKIEKRESEIHSGISHNLFFCLSYCLTSTYSTSDSYSEYLLRSSMNYAAYAQALQYGTYNKEQEFERQGKFIIDFLKSSKSLFIL